MFVALTTTLLSTCLCAVPVGAKQNTPVIERAMPIRPFSRSLADLAKASGKNLEDYRHFDKESVNTVVSQRRTYTLAVQSNVPLSIPGISMRQVVLLTPSGTILDRVRCEINSRYGSTKTEILDEPSTDGARIVIEFVGLAFPSGASTLDQRWHTIWFRDRFWTFWTNRASGEGGPTKWTERGLCRIGIADDKLVVLFPKLEMPNFGKAKSLRLRYRIDEVEKQLTIDDPKQVADLLSKMNVVGREQEGGVGGEYARATIDFVMPDGSTVSMGILSSRMFAGGVKIGRIHIETDALYKALRQIVFEATGTTVDLSKEDRSGQKMESGRQNGKDSGKVDNIKLN